MPYNDTIDVDDTVLAVAYLTISLLVIVSNGIVVVVIAATRDLHLPTLWNLVYMGVFDLSFGLYFLLIVTPCAFFGSNGIVVVVIAATRDLHLPTLWNLVYMGVFDLSFGLYFLLIVTPCAFFGRYQLSHPSVVPFAVLGAFLNGQVTMNTALALLDRYIAICWPLKYTRIITVRRWFAAVVTLVFLNSIRTCFIVLPHADAYYNPQIAVYVFDFNTVTNIASSVVFTVTTFGTIIFCLMKIVLELYRSRKRVSMTNSNPQTGLMRFSFTIAVSALVFLLSYSPLMFVTACNFILGKDGMPPVMLKIALVCMLSNSLWNSVIYATTYKPFKEAFLRLLFRKYYREKKREEVIQVIKLHGT